MNKTDIKRVIAKLDPDERLEYRLSGKIIKKQHSKFIFKPISSIASALVMVICIGILGYNFLNKKPTTSPPIINEANGLYVNKMELPTNTNATMDMIGLIVYQGKVYTQTGTKIIPGSEKNSLGEKLGITKGNIDEWSKQDDYAVEFASTTGKADVYSVNGYDKNFRIMTYVKTSGIIYADFYECLNGITIKTGIDVFNKLKIQNNIKTVKYESFNSWNNSYGSYKNITNFDAINNFVSELKNTIPYSQESLSSLYDDNGETNQKFIYITLNDNSEVQLRLFRSGYLYYNFCNVFFKMDNQAFNILWNELK